MATPLRGGTQCDLLHRLQQLNEQEEVMRGHLAQAEQEVETDPNNAEARDKIALLRSAKDALDMSMQALRQAYQEVQDAQIRRVTAAQAASNAGQSLRLVAPPPFVIGQDFDVFAAQMMNYVENVAFNLQKQALRSLLAADAFKACR